MTRKPLAARPREPLSDQAAAVAASRACFAGVRLYHYRGIDTHGSVDYSTCLAFMVCSRSSAWQLTLATLRVFILVAKLLVDFFLHFALALGYLSNA